MFRVELDAYCGPLDLLLYLVKHNELDLEQISLARVTEQFLQHVALLEELKLDEIGEFLAVASALLELKSRVLLPQTLQEEEPEQPPGQDLVERLLEYKKYRDVAAILEDRSRQWQRRLPRLADDVPPVRPDPADQPIREVELWDLVSAFGRIVRDNQAVQPASILYDDTPVQVYMAEVLQRLDRQPRVAFSELFSPHMHKSQMIGMFLAVLELVRHHRVVAEQADPYGEIWIMRGREFQEGLESLDVDPYEGARR